VPISTDVASATTHSRCNARRGAETIEAIVRYLAGRKDRRVLGVALIFVGALVAFAANIAALP
jgi:hypothetical protein